jgi:hypothetical protein
MPIESVKKNNPLHRCPSKRTGRMKRALLTSFLVGVSAASLAHSQSREYLLKSVFLERFTRFVEWPQESQMSDTTKPFILGYIGESPIQSTLHHTYSSQSIKNKPVDVRHLSRWEESADCHLLFIGKLRDEELTNVLSFTGDKPILTVADTKGYGRKGVLINFVISGDKVRFEINETAVRKSRLYVSHLLLNTAHIVHPLGKTLK